MDAPALDTSGKVLIRADYTKKLWRLYESEIATAVRAEFVHTRTETTSAEMASLTNLLRIHGRIFKVYGEPDTVIVCASCCENIHHDGVVLKLECDHVLCVSCALDHSGVSKYCPSIACWSHADVVLNEVYNPAAPRTHRNLFCRPKCSRCDNWAAFDCQDCSTSYCSDDCSHWHLTNSFYSRCSVENVRLGTCMVKYKPSHLRQPPTEVATQPFIESDYEEESESVDLCASPTVPVSLTPADVPDVPAAPLPESAPVTPPPSAFTAVPAATAVVSTPSPKAPIARALSAELLDSVAGVPSVEGVVPTAPGVDVSSVRGEFEARCDAISLRAFELGMRKLCPFCEHKVTSEGMVCSMVCVKHLSNGWRLDKSAEIRKSDRPTFTRAFNAGSNAAHAVAKLTRELNVTGPVSESDRERAIMDAYTRIEDATLRTDRVCYVNDAGFIACPHLHHTETGGVVAADGFQCPCKPQSSQSFFHAACVPQAVPVAAPAPAESVVAVPELPKLRNPNRARTIARQRAILAHSKCETWKTIEELTEAALNGEVLPGEGVLGKRTRGGH